MKKNILVIFLSLSVSGLYAQPLPVFNYIKDISDVREGGSGIFEYEGETLLVSVSAVIVGDKSQLSCKKVGESKAKREMVSYVNGFEITSYTELVISEDNVNIVGGRRIDGGQRYKEVIKERVSGSLNKVNPLGGWYSEDKSVYYYAIYKIIET